jgi:hypothetical protein
LTSSFNPSQDAAHTETESFGQELGHDTPPLGDQFKPFPRIVKLGMLQSMSKDKAKYFNRDYAAALATAVKKWFWGPLARKKSPKVSVLEAESSRRRHDGTSFLEKVIFSKIFAYHTPRTKILHYWGA